MRINCVACGEHVYNYTGRKTSIMESALCEPVNPEHPKPEPHSEMRCPYCDSQIIMLRSVGERAKKWLLQYRR